MHVPASIRTAAGRRGRRAPTLLVAAAALAACSQTGGPTPAMAGETSAGMPAARTAKPGAPEPAITPVDPSAVPARQSEGFSKARIHTTGEQPKPDDGGIGAARTVCAPSHFNFDDPLVFPGQPGRTHLHVFFGNTAVDASSTPESVQKQGNSTCRGGTVNRSAYWAPAIIDTANGRPVTPEQENFVYYKTGYFGVKDRDVRATPAGFRMIAGDAKSRRPQPRVAHFSCMGPGGEGSTIPDCPPGSTMRMSITFPQCWDGVNLSSPDHRSHVAYPIEGRGCADPRYPVAIFEISMQLNYKVPAGGNRGWRLSSDIEGTPAGSSGHGDWMNGWDQDVMDVFVTKVINKGYSASGGLGDGRALF